MDNQTNQPLLVAANITAGYSGVPVLHGLDLEVRPGEVVALLGPNGAGKTTTLMTLCGELTPSSGTVELFGARCSRPLYQRARAGLGLVTEKRAVLMNLTVHENLAVLRADRELALTLFPELVPHLARRVGLLSGGQQQILALACALARSPRLLLADELSLGLAPMVVDRLLAAARAAADEGVGVLLVEQHVRKALRVADRVYVLRQGRIELSGAAAELRESPELIEAVYLTALTRRRRPPPRIERS